MVQLREKHTDYETFVALAKEVKQITDQYQVPLLINDNLDVALAVDAAGVHVGQEDMAALEVRRRIGDKKVVGVSAQTVEQALAAEKAGADYLGVGAVFPTNSKDDAVKVDFATLRAICQAVQIPVVAIGGITADNMPALQNSGIIGGGSNLCHFWTAGCKSCRRTISGTLAGYAGSGRQIEKTS